MKHIQVKFNEGSHEYTYATDLDVKVGDMVYTDCGDVVRVVSLTSDYQGELKVITRKYN